MSETEFSHSLYYYISTRAGVDPCMTIYLCAPGGHVSTTALAEQYAIHSGWQMLAEKSGAVLVMPIAPAGWKNESPDLLKDIYRETRNQFFSRSGEAIWGRSGCLWCWETMLYLVGYEDGAVYAGNVLTAHPNMFAGAALVNGVTDDYTAGDHWSDHWLVPEASESSRRKNREIPVHLWLCTVDDKYGGMDGGGTRQEKTGSRAGEKGSVGAAAGYFSAAFGSCATFAVKLSGWSGEKIVSGENPACQVWTLSGNPGTDETERNREILTECFEHVIRWKNSPDGTLALRNSKEEFYRNPAFQRRTIEADGRRYEYFVHLPGGKDVKKDSALPLVFTVHGRGEPAWLFTTKNGWDTLADETGEFILVSPDSPGNIWFLPRDGAVFPAIVHDMAEHFPVDTERIYLTGFSNGGMMVRETAVRYPELFAGVSPWNAPVGNTGAMMREDSNRMSPEYDVEFTAVLQDFLDSGYEMPCAFIFGDQDNAADAASDRMIQPMLIANGCVAQEKSEGGHVSETLHQNGDHVTMVTIAVMKDMPHGALPEESRHTWKFLKQFSRERETGRIRFRSV